MQPMQPFSLRIFVADGDPDGLRIVERSNWVGRALVFPRAAWAQPSVADRPELQQTGVYLLLGPPSSTANSGFRHFRPQPLYVNQALT
jgi:hypothetical protein